MATCSPQRYFANHRNLIADAILTPSDVQAVSNAMLETQVAREGTAQVRLTGSYTGEDDAVFDFAIVDDTADTKLISTPVFAGSGSETLTELSITTAAQQKFTLECAIPGTDALPAKVDIEGVSIVARAPGTAGNGIHITVDESGLIYSATAFSLLTDLKTGDGKWSDAPLKGPEYDWETATVGADDVIPDTAKRLVFDGDESSVYTQFKKFVDGDWQYFLVPEAKNDYPAGTKVKFVTGSREITITDGVTPDVLSAIVTVFDYLDAVKTASALCDVEGVVADDRTPTGQSARELNLHTIARHGYSYGSGSKAARGFTDVTVEPAANTELITAECVGVSPKDLPGAYLGHEIWQLNGSVQGDLGLVYTDVPIVNDTFTATIPLRMPPSIAQKKGKFTLTSFALPRSAGEIAPDICFDGALGPGAVDQTITLVLTARDPSSCECKSMPAPELDGFCLGTAGSEDENVSYSAEAQTRMEALYDWARDLATAVSTYIASLAVPPGAKNTAALDGDASTSVTGSNSQGGTWTGTVRSDAISGVDVLHPPAPVTTGYADVGLPANFASLLDFYEDGLVDIDTSVDTSLRAAGFTAFDDALDAWKADLDVSALDTLGNRLYSLATDKYKALVNRARAYAGVSPKGKGNASNLTSGDGCWQDFGDQLFWEVVGSENGAYAPAFTNHAYWSSQLREVSGGKAYFSTKEFAFTILVACPQYLKAGDTLTLTIGDAGQGATYQVGDMLFLPLIAAQDLYLTGGRAADLVQTWYLTGDVEGPFPQYVFDPGAPVAYPSGNGLTFLLVMGGVVPGKGDKFEWYVNGGHYKWRKDGGAWSADLPILDGAQVFQDGLSVEFLRGVNPSFVTNDIFTFRVFQQWRAANVKRPSRDVHFPGVPTWTLKALFASIQPITAFMLAYHTIPSDATIEIVGGDVEDVIEWTETITWRAFVIAQMTSEPRTGIWCRLEITGAVTGAESAVGWWWAGVPDATGLSSDATPKLNYKIERGAAGGLYQTGAYLGKTMSAEIEWSEVALSESDVTMLTEMLDHVKSNNDEPIVFMPNVTRPDAFLAHIVDDEIPTPDVFGLQPNLGFERRHSARLSLQGVWG